MVSKLASAIVIGAALAGCAKQPTTSNTKSQPLVAKLVLNIEQSTPAPKGVFGARVPIKEAEKILSQIEGTDKYAVIFANSLEPNQTGEPQIFVGKIENVAIQEGMFLNVRFKALNDSVLSSYERTVAGNDKSYDSLSRNKIERNKLHFSQEAIDSMSGELKDLSEEGLDRLRGQLNSATFEDYPFSSRLMSPFSSITHIAIVSAE